MQLIDELYGEGAYEGAAGPQITKLTVIFKKKNHIPQEAVARDSSSYDMMMEKQSFKDILTGNGGEPSNAIRIKHITTPHMVGGNMVVEVDEDGYKRGVEEWKFTMVGRLFIQKGNVSPMIL